jgi:hypothetical protein
MFILSGLGFEDPIKSESEKLFAHQHLLMLKRIGQARPAVHMPTIIKRLSHQIIIV